jgi:hypothetical protein
MCLTALARCPVVDRKAINTALAKALAYKQCGKEAEVDAWAAELVRLLGAAHILKDCPMTIKKTLAAIKALSPDLTARWIKDTGEYRISFSIYAIGRKWPELDHWDKAEEKNEAMAYYTEDAEDALGTAAAMVAQWNT